MSEYTVKTAPSHSLVELEKIIIDEEFGASEFVSAAATNFGEGLMNRITFKRLEAGTIPEAPTLARHGGTAPPGKAQAWTGVMLVSGSMTAVELFR